MGGNKGKIVIIVIALSAAVIIFFVTNRPEKVEQPTVEAKNMICLDSGKHFTLSPEEYDRRYAAAPEREAEGGGRGARGGARKRLPRLIACPECDGGNALLASKCPNSDTWYPVYNEDGTKGSCPD